VEKHKATKISKAVEPIGVDVKQFHSGDQEAAWAIKLCALLEKRDII